jgi:hypothetical protein
MKSRRRLEHGPPTVPTPTVPTPTSPPKQLLHQRIHSRHVSSSALSTAGPGGGSSSTAANKRRLLLVVSLYVATAALVGTTMLLLSQLAALSLAPPPSLPGLVPALPLAAPAAGRTRGGGQRGGVAAVVPDAKGSTTTTTTTKAKASTPTAVKVSALSPLEDLYEATNHGRGLAQWARHRAQSVYPSLFATDLPENERGEVVMGNPSLAHDPRTNGTVLGFRIQVMAVKKRVRMARYLMLCERRRRNMAAAEQEETIRAAKGLEEDEDVAGRWKCQDSGWDAAYVPPECDPRFWGRPEIILPYGPLTRGPEDARLFFDSAGNLGATVMVRGCHPFTTYGNRTALWSVYTVRWNRTNDDEDGTWTMDRSPKVLDLRTSTLGFLGDSYPFATKSWVAIPTQSKGATRAASPPASDVGMLLSVGWTPGMADHVVYKVAQTSETLSAVVPANSNVNHSHADVRTYRASTNLVHWKGAVLLGMGHRQVHTATTKTYYHYWYAFCAEPPYRAVALSDPFLLPDDPHVGTSFALGLAWEGPHVYLAWSENDTRPCLSRYDSSDVGRVLAHSSFARERGTATKLVRDNSMDDLAALCARQVNTGDTAIS